jgi:hypothetical protein
MTGFRPFWILCVAYVASLGAVVVGGFFYEAVGLWLSIVWGLSLVALVGFWARTQRRRSLG